MTDRELSCWWQVSVMLVAGVLGAKAAARCSAHFNTAFAERRPASLAAVMPGRIGIAAVDDDAELDSLVTCLASDAPSAAEHRLADGAGSSIFERGSPSKSATQGLSERSSKFATGPTTSVATIWMDTAIARAREAKVCAATSSRRPKVADDGLQGHMDAPAPAATAEAPEHQLSQGKPHRERAILFRF